MIRSKTIKTWFGNGAEDSAPDIASISEHPEMYLWIEIEVLPTAG